MQGPKGFPQLIVKNFIYIKHSESSKTGHWRCRGYSSQKCKAQCKVKENEVVLLNEHSHLPDHNKVRDREVITQFWARVCQSTKDKN